MSDLFNVGAVIKSRSDITRPVAEVPVSPSKIAGACSRTRKRCPPEARPKTRFRLALQIGDRHADALYCLAWPQLSEFHGASSF